MIKFEWHNIHEYYKSIEAAIVGAGLALIRSQIVHESMNSFFTGFFGALGAVLLRYLWNKYFKKKSNQNEGDTQDSSSLN